MRSRLLPRAAVCCTLLASPALGCASSPREQLRRRRARDAGCMRRRRDRRQRHDRVLAANSRQSETARQGRPLIQCETGIETAAELLKSRPTQAAQLRSYASTVKVTLYGDTATVPNLSGGGRTTLSYTHGFWYLASS